VKNLTIEIRIIDSVDLDIIEVINMISLSRLIDGGAAIFAAVNKNHHIDIVGAIIISPLVRNILRVCVISYDILAIINRADELRPWAIIIIRALERPHTVFDNIPVSINPIWPTDEYAIKDFKSGCRMQIILVAAAPDNAILISIDALREFSL